MKPAPHFFSPAPNEGQNFSSIFFKSWRLGEVGLSHTEDGPILSTTKAQTSGFSEAPEPGRSAGQSSGPAEARSGGRGHRPLPEQMQV